MANPRCFMSEFQLFHFTNQAILIYRNQLLLLTNNNPNHPTDLAFCSRHKDIGETIEIAFAREM